MSSEEYKTLIKIISTQATRQIWMLALILTMIFLGIATMFALQIYCF